MDDGLSKKPWEHYSYNYIHTYHTRYYKEPEQCSSHFTTVKDSKRLSYRKCDLIRYYRKYRYELFGDWRDWFPEKPKKKRVESNSRIPKKLAGQYGIVIQRFRKTKHKGITYNDYGTSILLLTGKHKGLMKDWYNTSYPFTTIARFPYVDPLPKILMSNLTKMLGKDPVYLCQYIDDCEEQRDWFLQKIWNTLQEKINEERRYNKTL
jgi:hypothetical protein